MSTSIRYEYENPFRSSVQAQSRYKLMVKEGSLKQKELGCSIIYSIKGEIYVLKISYMSAYMMLLKLIGVVSSVHHPFNQFFI